MSAASKARQSPFECLDEPPKQRRRSVSRSGQASPTLSPTSRSCELLGPLEAAALHQGDIEPAGGEPARQRDPRRAGADDTDVEVAVEGRALGRLDVKIIGLPSGLHEAREGRSAVGADRDRRAMPRRRSGTKRRRRFHSAFGTGRTQLRTRAGWSTTSLGPQAAGRAVHLRAAQARKRRVCVLRQLSEPVKVGYRALGNWKDRLDPYTPPGESQRSRMALDPLDKVRPRLNRYLRIFELRYLEASGFGSGGRWFPRTNSPRRWLSPWTGSFCGKRATISVPMLNSALVGGHRSPASIGNSAPGRSTTCNWSASTLRGHADRVGGRGLGAGSVSFHACRDQALSVLPGRQAR